MATLPTIVQGNSFALAIPLKVYVIGEGEVVLVDYTPDEGDSITVQLRGNRRVYSYTPTTEGNVATISLAGNELAGIYDTVVTIIKDDDTHLRAFKSGQLAIVESVDDMTEGELADGINAGAIYLDPQIFIRGEQGEDGRGIVSIAKTATSGLVDTYTITYTDGTTSTFTVTNGADGQDGQDGTDGVGIASITEQTSSASGGVNVVTVILTDGTILSFTVRNGIDGQTPDMSDYALKNGDIDENFAAKDFTSSSVATNSVTISQYATFRGNAPRLELVNTLGNSSILFPYDKSGTLALISDIISQLSTYCPIIEDTRSSAVANITGVAPFSQLVDGQRIILRLAYATANGTTLDLTLSDGTTTTGAKAIYSSRSGQFQQVGSNYGLAGTLIYAIYDNTNSRWNALPVQDTNTTYASMTQQRVDEGTSTGAYTISPKLLCDNFDKVTTLVEVQTTGDVTQALESGKFYKFGTVDSLTITLTAASAGMGIWGGKFTASANWSALGLPATVDEAAGNDTVASGKTYEFNIIDNVIVIKEV